MKRVSKAEHKLISRLTSGFGIKIKLLIPCAGMRQPSRRGIVDVTAFKSALSTHRSLGELLSAIKTGCSCGGCNFSEQCHVRMPSDDVGRPVGSKVCLFATKLHEKELRAQGGL